LYITACQLGNFELHFQESRGGVHLDDLIHLRVKKSRGSVTISGNDMHDAQVKEQGTIATSPSGNQPESSAPWRSSPLLDSFSPP
jgi:hypothetical protein